jgi:mRNA interferase MazF
MPTFSQGDVIRVPFPYLDRDIEQRRPALVISDGALGNGFLLWVAMITSAGGRAWPGDLEVKDLTLAGLPAPSIIRTLKVATIEAERAQLLGKVDAATRRAVMAKLRTHLAL